MLVSITAPIRAVGQSVTTINLSARVTQLIKEKALIVDLNQHRHDMADYLSNSRWTKGMDEFKNLLDAGMLKNPGYLHKCVKTVNPMIDIMDSNECFEINQNDINQLIVMVKQQYQITLLDTMVDDLMQTREVLNQSEAVVVLLNQEKRAIHRIRQWRLYQEQRDKVIFVINGFIEGYQKEKIKYDEKTIKKELQSLGFVDNQIFIFPFDPELLNECNDGTILNYGFNSLEDTSGYHQELERMAKYLLVQHGGYYFEAEEGAEGIKKKLFNLLQP